MSERRPRTGRVVGLAEGVAAAVRRRQREREPRVMVFGPGGTARVVAPSAPRYDDLLDAAERMLEESGAKPASSRAGRLDAEDDEDEVFG